MRLPDSRIANAEGPSCGVEDTIVLFGQHLRNQHADVRLVVDDEDRLAKAAFHGGLFLSRVIVDRTRMPWKVDTHRGTLADFRIGPDLPAGLPDEPVDHREAEAGPFSERLSREERIERLRDDVRWHSGPGVGNAQRQILSRREFALARRSVVEPFVGGLDRQTTPSGMASRALMHRLRSALSSCGASTLVGHSPAEPTTSTAI
jgi:hypothetical protein